MTPAVVAGSPSLAAHRRTGVALFTARTPRNRFDDTAHEHRGLVVIHRGAQAPDVAIHADAVKVDDVAAGRRAKLSDAANQEVGHV